jgi:hypothetical protein
MASPEDLARELGDVGGLITAQVAAGMNREEVMQSVFNSWASRLGACAKMTPKSKTMLTTAIQQGPWECQQRKDLASIVLGGSGTQSASKKANSRRPNQSALKFENLMRAETMVKLRNAGNFSRISRMSIIAAEARYQGIECPSQPTLLRMVSILAYGENNFDMTQEEVHGCMDTIQTFIKSVPRNSQLEYIQHYPVSAALLPDSLKKALFPDGALPPEVHVPELDTILKLHKMRGRHYPKGRKERVPAWLAEVPEDRREAVLTAYMGNTAPAQPASSGPASAGAAPITSAITAPIANVFRFQSETPPARTQEPCAGEEQEEQDEEEHDGEEEEEADSNTIDELEAQLVAASQARSKAMKVMAKPASALKRPAAKSDEPVLKRPAAKDGPVLKRPAAKELAAVPKTAPAKTRKVPKSSTWKLIHSTIYQKARKEAYAKYKNDKKAKDIASAACATAKKKFLKGTLKDPRTGV